MNDDSGKTGNEHSEDNEEVSHPPQLESLFLSINTPRGRERGTVGRPVPGTKTGVIGEDRHPVPPGQPAIGDPDDGGVYVGKSATTGKDLHAALADEPDYVTYGEAFAAAARMRQQPGRENAHVPTPEELNVNLYQNRDKGALRGTFNTSGLFPASCYRSSAPYGNVGSRVQWFGGGYQLDNLRLLRLPVRLVW
jgi:hypothetical protein